MGYKDAKIARDPRWQQQAAFTSGLSRSFREGIKASGKRRAAEEKNLKDLQKKAAASTQGYYDKIAEYEKTGNQSIDKQFIELLEQAARDESAAYMRAMGPDGTTEDLVEYQTIVAGNKKDIGDLTVFVGTFDQGVDEIADAVAQDPNSVLGLKAPHFDFSMAIQNNTSTPKVVKGFDDGKGNFIETSSITDKNDPNYGRGSYNLLADPTSKKFAGQTIDLEDWNNKMKENNGSYYKIKDDEYNLKAEKYLEGVDEGILKEIKQNLQSDQPGGTPIAVGQSTTGGGKVTWDKISKSDYKNAILNKLPKLNTKTGVRGKISDAGGTLDSEQLFHMIGGNNIQFKRPAGLGYTKPTAWQGSYEDLMKQGKAGTDALYSAYADWYIDNLYPGSIGKDDIQLNQKFTKVTTVPTPKITK